MITPPPANLGPMAAPWERWATGQLIQNANAIESLGGDASNDGRANNSTMDNMATQINELVQRQSGLVAAPEVSTIDFSSGTVITPVTIQIPRPTDARRIGWMSVQAVAQNSNANQTEVYASMSVDGSVFHRDSRAVPTSNLEPASWNGDKAFTGFTGFIASPSDGGLVTLEFQAQVQFSPGVRSVRYKDIQVTYQYGQKV